MRERLRPGGWAAATLEPGDRYRVEMLAAGQVVELVAHASADPRERLATTLTTLVEFTDETHVGMVLWSQNYTPLLRVTGQTHGRHDLQLEACTPFVNQELLGLPDATSCAANFEAALAELGLGPKWIPYPLGLFRACGDVDGRFRMLPGTSEPGDFVEFAAETAVTVVASACPAQGGADADTVELTWREPE